jgi:5'(3')-deoxyribonucleotidase
MEQKYHLFIDMDGVLTDFIKGYHELTGKDISGEYHNNDDFWDPINKAGYDFWINLKWKEDGKKLWKYIEKYNPTVLSAPSKKDDSRVGKHDWIKRELPGVHLILRTAKNKKEFAAPDSILIDDLKDNVDSWKEAGGIGILHTSADDTIKKLKDLKL